MHIIPYKYKYVAVLNGYIHVCDWRDALETVINSRKLPDALGNPSTQRKRYYNPIWQITLYITDKNNTTHF